MDNANNTENFSEEKTVKYSAIEKFFAWLCVLLGYLFCRAFPLSDNPLGMFVVIFVSLAVTAAVLLKRGARFGVSAIGSAVLCVVFGTALIFSANAFAQFFAFLGSVLGYSYFVYTATGNKIEKGFSDLLPVDFALALLVMPFKVFGRVWAAMFTGKKSAKPILKILLGVAVAIIPTAVVTNLLSYDEGFSKLLKDAFSFLKDFNLFSHLFSLSIGGIVAMYVFGMYSSCADGRTDSVTREKCTEAFEKAHFLPSLTTAVALLPLVVVYVFFFISQWQYYVSAFSGKLPEGLSYAAYARGGFFELCSVSAINFVVLAAAALFMKRKGKGESILLKTANIVISLMTLVLIATAISKMALYIQSYGLTEKRVTASWFMILLALIFVLIIIKQFVTRLKLIPASGIALALMLALLTLSNYNGIIADYNVDRYIDGTLESVDIEALEELGMPALPAIIRCAEYYEEKYGVEIKEVLSDDTLKMEDGGTGAQIVASIRILKVSLDSNEGFTSLTVPAIKARSALEKYLGK